MKAHEESLGWGTEQRFPCGDSATGIRSNKWRGYRETSCQSESTQWEGKGGTWDQFNSDTGRFFAEFENIMHWDDSGAQEAFQIAREQYKASVSGFMYPMSLPDPDLYIQIVDWDTHEAFDLPESADMLFTRGERKRQRRRAPRDGQFQCNRKGIVKSGRPYHLGAGGWRQINTETVFGSNLWQANLRQSGLDQPMPDVNGFSNAPPQITVWEEGKPSQVQSFWQDWETSHFGWQSNPWSQPSYEGRPNSSSEQAALSNAWVYGNNIIQAPPGMQTGRFTDYPQTNPNAFAFGTSGMNDVNLGEWMAHYQRGGQNMKHCSMVRHCLQDNRVPGNLGQEYVCSSDWTQRWWRESKWKCHHNRY